jgi:hypothetical protein
MTDPAKLAAVLRTGARHDDRHVRAVVELLIDHKAGSAATTSPEPACAAAREAWICWPDARRFADSGPVSSASELAILDHSVALGENRYRLSIMGSVRRQRIETAVARATGVER